MKSIAVGAPRSGCSVQCTSSCRSSEANRDVLKRLCENELRKTGTLLHLVEKNLVDARSGLVDKVSDPTHDDFPRTPQEAAVWIVPLSVLVATTTTTRHPIKGWGGGRYTMEFHYY